MEQNKDSSDNGGTNLGLDPNRLSMIDAHGSRFRIIPAEVRGLWKKRRDLVYAFLIILFLVLPWTRINGEQTILLDIPQRKFALFGITFWAHDAPMIFLILAMFVFGLTLITSLWGRIWCGWACPQTVFIDFIYRRIERWVEGDYIQRRKLDKEDLSVRKAFKLGVKWTLFFLVSSLIAHSFAAYFVGSDLLTQWVYSGDIQAHQTTFLIVLFITAILLFDFGWFREQFCIIMCPYGRFQSVLMDQRSLAVLYDEKRGEPRKGLEKPGQARGDCVSCNRCVQVCPTGIDIRKGLQMECIACTACIDACDDIMTKVKKPTGLIKYSTVSGKENKIYKGRQLLYFAVNIFLFVMLLFLVSSRKSIDIAVLRAQEAPYQIIDTANGKKILNHFKLHSKNQHTKDLQLSIDFPAELGLEIRIQSNPFTVKAGESQTTHFFVLFDPKTLDSSGNKKISIRIKTTSALQNEADQSQEISLIGPNQTGDAL
ncbi:MAG: cytochrome c oxidase accessory protein CcoG [Bdellovibrionaceae bacterium]|nr:cytochrome c oxidase accessory protein CcoG [Pseudobdellovibrionaceae bacterium]